MLKRILLVCLSALILFSFIPFSLISESDKRTNEFQARDGVLDLSAWNYEQDQRITLDGTWEFYWNQLLTPDDFRQNGPERLVPDTMMKVPGQWNGKTVNGKPLPAYGSATYRLVLKNVPFDGVYALKKTNVRFASTVYANGQMLFEDGKTSVKAAGYEAGNVPQFAFFSAEKGDVEIIVQVANFAYANSGIAASLYFGEQAAMMDFQQKAKARDLTIFGILTTLALIFFLCYVTAAYYGKKDSSLLLFALICFFYAVYNGLIGERVMLMYVHGIPFEVLFKVKDLCTFSCFIALALFFYQLKKGILSRWFTRAFIVVLSVYMTAIVLLPIPIYTKAEPYIILLYESTTIWLLLRTAVLYIQSEHGERLKAFLLFMAMLCFTLYSIDLILFSFSLKESFWLGELYIVVFNIILIFLVVLRFFEAYHTVDAMRIRLLQLDKLKDEFLSNTSHELKTPLNAIVSISESLLRGVEGPVTEKQAQNLEIVMGSGRRLTLLVNELLDYSKMKHGDIVLYRNGMDLQAVTDSVLKIHMFLLGSKRISLVNGISASFPAVYADGNRLVQILHNLIGNAIKFTEQGTVEISAEIVRDMAQIRIRDTGVGIPEHMQERIFDAFEQADTPEIRNEDGTGLGLSITKKLVELHGGEINVQSSPGEGAVFTFTLPLLDKASSQMAPLKIEKSQPSSGFSIPITEFPLYMKGEIDEPILIVDDDYANLQSITNLLKLEKYAYVAVNRGEMALEELSRKSDFFLVVLDISMPDMSGYEVLRKIRERFSPFELPVLMLTAQNRLGEIKLSMENGANDFVGKPYEADELMARVRSLTRLKASVKHAKDAEIAFLRSQIKPHFLYNALNSIAELCVDEPAQAEDLTLQLSQYMRSSFDFKQLDSLTTIESEMKLVTAYVNIERARYGARVQVEYNVTADPYTRIPPLIVQPLVENAIRHGLMSNFRGGSVTVTIQQGEDAVIRFAIEDNGSGMSASKLEELLRPSEDKKGVGLWNISQRIKLLYGKGLHIESEEGKGTKISFDIPVQSAMRTDAYVRTVTAK
ncbi:ATP-binding protein [Paenibacillus thalictri]|uniref:ATP-binding protein n=1 Tax=Paenibacillus thalictri TaxID=2527873 RepID=UPI0013EF2BBE|nr:ATP-binding protein [Paenibacillus thalictri]